MRKEVDAGSSFYRKFRIETLIRAWCCIAVTAIPATNVKEMVRVRRNTNTQLYQYTLSWESDFR
jgi:hypothetical protein